jgi:hypothetical protein
MVNQFPALPLDVIRECFRHLEWKDLLACRQTCSLFRQMIDDSEQLQLRIHLAENAIRSVDATAMRSDGGIDSVPGDASQELSRLRHLATRYQQVRFGQEFADTSTFQLTATNLADMHMVGLVDDFIFVPLPDPRTFGLGGIARHRCRGSAAPPNLMRFTKPVMHFEVESSEGALLVATQVSAR